jgi:hypothetical protein
MFTEIRKKYANESPFLAANLSLFQFACISDLKFFFKTKMFVNINFCDVYLNLFRFKYAENNISFFFSRGNALKALQVVLCNVTAVIQSREI